MKYSPNSKHNQNLITSFFLHCHPPAQKNQLFSDYFSNLISLHASILAPPQEPILIITPILMPQKHIKYNHSSI